MKTILLTFLIALLFANFACFSGRSGGNEGNDSGKPEQNNTNTKIKESTGITKMDTTIKTDTKFTDLNKDAFRLHYDAIVIDTHNDILMPVFLQGAKLDADNAGTQSDLVKWKKRRTGRSDVFHLCA